MESGIRTNPKRIAQMFDRLEQCVAERLRSEVLTCSQITYSSPPIDAGTQTEHAPF
ncbi:hypothetical protein PHET_10174 [Paragonimus heterotremus]|uniref:Uncharacterized protein n=1 Tax=Paragonimus heterotremus TaxID=100268 RepID=A0A8J4WTZ6_9TREM|nr:hypothetical protein PHET_10174 [Paragonimus heterotremus]